MIEPGIIHLTRVLPHPPSRVWMALTDPAIHTKWWAAGEVRAVVGHRFSLDMGPWGLQPCEVLAVEHERLLSFSFAPGALNSTITWRLVPEEGGTRLSLEHKGFDLASPPGKTAFHGMSSGWPTVIDRLQATLGA